ncbi:MAG: hypothetical protein ACI92I_000671 [Acidimicrobiales bacterium]|jgi:hypothetical protein
MKKPIGSILITVGIIAVVAATGDDIPGQVVPLWWVIGLAMSGIVTIIAGYKLFRSGGGGSFFQ